MQQANLWVVFKNSIEVRYYCSCCIDKWS